MSSMWYQMELIARERHERMQRESEAWRINRLAAGQLRRPTRPRRLRLMNRR